jgi:XTP/dITP diphosphohydrolase
VSEPVRKIVLATRNRGKLREMREILRDVPVELATADDLGAPHVAETGTTFEENATLKAVAVAKATGLMAIADDSGLEVPALDHAPGVHSARYSEEGTDAANNRRLCTEIAARGLTRPPARFVCVMVLATPEGVRFTVRGEVGGEITPEPHGASGFGYDPVFYCPELGKTFGEASPVEKERVSHRGRALRKLAALLQPELENPDHP